MDTVLFIGVGLLYFGAAIYFANEQEATGQRAILLRWMLYSIAALTILAAFNVLQVALLSELDTLPEDLALPPISLPAAIANLVLALAAGGLSVAVVSSPGARLLVRRIVASHGDYNPDSPVHTTAIVLSLSVISLSIAQLVFSGGIAGFAQAVEETGIAPGQLLFQGILWVIVALLGVGLAIRRTPQQTLERLGLRPPSLDDLRTGISGGVLLWLLTPVFGLVWSALVPSEQLAEQTAAAEQIAQAVNTLPLALLVSLSSAVGEEIFFRGAVQPVFGVLLTSIFFAIVHTQYTLTPAALLIWIVALGLGWIRSRYSTSAAIIAHFLYNFIPLVLVLLFGSTLGNL